MKIKLTSIMVDDQDKALKFYTDVLGFVKKTEFPAGDFKWITVVSPDAPDDVELSLEPNANPALGGAEKAFQATLMRENIPYIAFAVDDLQKEYERLTKLGVVFTMEPTTADWGSQAVLNDTCGNLVMLYQS